MAAARDYYELLDVPRTATDLEIRSAYRRLSRSVHPDVGGSAALFGLIDDAYAVLSDPIRRADYDRRLREGVVDRLPSEEGRSPAPPPGSEPRRPFRPARSALDSDLQPRWRTAAAVAAATALVLAITLLVIRENSSGRGPDDAVTPPPGSATATPATPTGGPSTPVALPSPAIPLPGCTDPCGVLHALTRRFLPGNRQKQQLLIAGTPGSSGNAGAYVISSGAQPTVLFAAANLGPFVRLDRRRPIRDDSTGHVFFQAVGPTGLRLLVIGFEGGMPHLIPPLGGSPDAGFPNGKISRISASGQLEITADCLSSCPGGQTVAAYHWIDGQYRPVAPGGPF